MVLQHNFKTRHRDRNESWFLREMCKDLKDYLLSLSLDEGYESVLYHVGGVDGGETSEIFAQEFPFLNIVAIDDWSQAPNLELEFDDRLKFYQNIVKFEGKSQDFEQEIVLPSIVYIDGCREEQCITDDLYFWLNKMNSGSVLSGYNLSFKKYNKPALLPKFKRALLNGIGNKPHKTYLDGSWYYIL